MGEGYNLPPVKPLLGVDYICFTDQTDLEPNNWTIEKILPLFASDLPRSSRNHKIRPHLFLKEYERSLYIDPSVSLIGNPLLLWEFLVNSPGVVFGAVHHSYREKVLDDDLRP